jgi:hypothetical protein
MKSQLFFAIMSILLFRGESLIKGKSQNFEGSIEFNYIRNCEIFRTDKHLFSENNYAKICQYFSLNFDLGDLIFDLENDNRILIKHSLKTWQNLGIEKQSSSNSKSEIIPTEEFTEILGYKCRKYIHKKYSSEFYKTTISWIWIAEDLKFQKLNKIAKITADNSTISAIHTMSEGIPLRIDFPNEDNEKMSYMEATKIVKNIVSRDNFDIPQGYKLIRGN